MELISILFGNPAVKILEARLWETARRRYLGEHPTCRKDDAKAVMRRVKTEYKQVVAAALKDEEQKVKATWAEFKKVMTEELRAALTTVLHMSSLEWYSIEEGRLPSPKVIAVPCELLKHVTAELLPQLLRKKIEFEGLDDATLEALATYAVDEKFHELLSEARHNQERFKIGQADARFAVLQSIKRDAYFLSENQHHSLIDMVLLGCATEDPHNGNTSTQKGAFHKWFDEYLKNRKDDRRFTGDGWEIEPQELESWAVRP